MEQDHLLVRGGELASPIVGLLIQPSPTFMHLTLKPMSRKAVQASVFFIHFHVVDGKTTLVSTLNAQ